MSEHNDRPDKFNPYPTGSDDSVEIDENDDFVVQPEDMSKETSFLLVLFGFLMLPVAWYLSLRICFGYSPTLIGILVGGMLLPAALKAGMTTAGFALFSQLGFRAFKILWKVFWGFLTAVPRRLLGKDEPTPVDDPVGELLADLSWGLALFGFTIGVVATCVVAAALFSLFATAQTPGFFEMTLKLSAFHVVCGAILAGLGFEASI